MVTEYLSSDERRVLKLAEQRYTQLPPEFSKKEYASIVRRLERKGFVGAVFSINDHVSMVWLTDVGEKWLEEYRRVPVCLPLKTIATVATIALSAITAISGLIAMVSCSLILSALH